MYGLKGVVDNLNINNVFMKKRRRIEGLSEEFILVNPLEIKKFISDKPNLIDLINTSSILIHHFFPSSKIYLEYKDDPEYDDFDALFAYIINENSIEHNNIIYNELLRWETLLEKSSLIKHIPYALRTSYF